MFIRLMGIFMVMAHEYYSPNSFQPLGDNKGGQIGQFFAILQAEILQNRAIWPTFFIRNHGSKGVLTNGF